ncbi:hypothetical protein I5R58_09750 [Serratia marcescens]|nr:hypothetical protein [Serratia marcescens]HEJ9150377.1 hypothetical protein [Serratia marcescens]
MRKITNFWFGKIAVKGFLIVVGLFSCGAYAGWDMDVKVAPSSSMPNVRDYTVKMVYWDTNDTTPNPLYRCSWRDCSLYFGIKTGWDGNFRPISPVTFPEITTSKTLGELAGHFTRRGYMNREYSRSEAGANDTRETCFILMYFFDSEANTGYLPIRGGSACVIPEVLPTVCDFGERQLELNHGMVRAEDINGHTVSTPLHMKCSSELGVRVMAADSSDYIYFNGQQGFRSELKVDNMNLGQGKYLQVTPAGVTLNLSSTLAGYDGSIGVLQGSKAIIITLP